MGKGKRRNRKIKGGHPARRSRLRVIEGDAGMSEVEAAQMRAWRKAGCPRPGQGPRLR